MFSTCFILFLKTKRDIKKLLKTTVLYGEFENEKKNDKKNFDLPEQGFEP